VSSAACAVAVAVESGAEVMREALREGAVILAAFEGGVFVGLRVARDPRKEGDKMAIAIGKYRMRGVEVSGSETKDNRIPYVEVMCEIMMGPELGARVKWRGYLHTVDSGKRTLEALRVMGWRGRGRADLEALRRGSMGGIGRAEFVGEVQHDIAQKNGREVRYPRVAFVNALGRLAAKAETDVTVGYDLDALFSGEAAGAGADDGRAMTGGFDPETGELAHTPGGDAGGDDFPAAYKLPGEAATARAERGKRQRNGRADASGAGE
jgi:hypothetical protein